MTDTDMTCMGCKKQVPKAELITDRYTWPKGGWWVKLYNGQDIEPAEGQLFFTEGLRPTYEWMMMCHDCMVRLLREFPGFAERLKIGPHCHRPVVGQRCCEWGDWS